MTLNNWEHGKTDTISAINYYKLIQFFTYCPIEKVPKTTGAQILFYRKHTGISRKCLAKQTGIKEVELKLWERENFRVQCFNFGFTATKKQKLKKVLKISKLVEPSASVLDGNLPKNLKTTGQHLQHRRKVLGISKREACEILQVHRNSYARWERDTVNLVCPVFFLKLVEFLGYCPLEKFVTEGARISLYRRYKGMDFSQLAHYLNCHPKTISKWEKGQLPIPQKRKEKLEKILEMKF